MFKHTFHLFSRTQKHLLLLFLFIILSILVFCPTIYGSPFWDDWVFIFRNGTFYNQPTLSYFLDGQHSRSWPIFFATIKFLLNTYGNKFYLYHLSSLFLHGVNAFLTWKILSKIKVKNAFWLAILYLVHPLQLFVVGWIIQFKTILSSFFFLCSLFFLLRYSRYEKLMYLFTAITLFLLALLSKSTPVAIIGIAPIGYYHFKDKIKFRQFALILIPVLLLSTFATIRTMWSFNFKELLPNFIEFIVPAKSNSSPAPLLYNQNTLLERTHLSLKILSRYLVFLAVPASNPLFQKRTLPTYGAPEFIFILSGLFLIVYVGKDIFEKNDFILKSSYVFFFISLVPFCGFFWIPIFSYSNFIPYWMSLPLLGVLPIISHYIQNAKHLIALILLYAITAHIQSYDLKVVDNVFLDSLEHSPNESIYYVALIEHYIYTGKCQEARDAHTRLTKISKTKEIPLLIKIGRCNPKSQSN